MKYHNNEVSHGVRSGICVIIVMAKYSKVLFAVLKTNNIFLVYYNTTVQKL
jgi:hypothetical protein